MAVSLNGDGTITGLSTIDSVTITGLTSLSTTDLTADTTTLVVDSVNNRVGIGTASPAGTLHSYINTATPTVTGVFQNVGGQSILQIVTPNTHDGILAFGDPEDGNVGRITYNHPSNYMHFITGDNERMRIDSSGNVGIGTSSPSAKLEINGIVNSQTDGTSDARYRFQCGSNSGWFGIPTWDNDSLRVYAPTTTTAEAQIASFNTSGSDAWVFLTGSTPAERMRINSSGNVGIGTSSPQGTLSVLGQGRIVTIGSSPFANTPELKARTAADTGYAFFNISTYRTKFFTEGSERMVITEGGNVGIGTSIPSQKLHVSGGNGIISHSAGNTVTLAVAGNGNSIGSGAFEFIQGGDDHSYIVNRANADIRIYTNNTERMRIDSSGRVGIGLVPSEMLEVNGNAHFRGTSANSPCLQLGQFTDLPYNPLVQMFCDDVSGDIFDITLGRYVSDYRWSRSSSNGKTLIARMFSGNGTPRSTQFYLYNQDAGAATSTVAVGINTSGNSYFNGGNVGIGTSSPSAKLQVNASATGVKVIRALAYRGVSCENGATTGETTDGAFYSYTGNAPSTSFNHYGAQCGGAVVFKVLGNGNVQNTNNSYGAISDVKLKENIVDTTSKLSQLNQVRVVNYNFIGDAQKQIGVIAQELESIFPSMVEEIPERDEEGNDIGTTAKSVKYSVFVPILIKAIQEQQETIKALEARIEALENPS